MSALAEKPIEKPADRRIQLIWNEQADPQALTLLRTARADAEGADGQLRDKLRVLQGQQIYKHNHYDDEMFFQHDAARGVVQNVYGQRLIRVSEDFLVAILGGLEEEVGDAAGEIMYKVGYEWGMEDMRSFVLPTKQHRTSGARYFSGS
ncbi:MAG: hypothetical protein JNM56_34840 [Planctomycetia bacterium]|nr:hypothetical protein [Planctomycetia bacterium]